MSGDAAGVALIVLSALGIAYFIRIDIKRRGK